MAVHIVPTQFASINDAIAASAPGDTIKILAGTFNESVTIPAGKDRLTIVGVWPRVTTITGTTGPVITVDSNLVTIQNLTVGDTPTFSGIMLTSDANVIRNVEVRNCRRGIEILSASQANFIVDCNIHNNNEAGIQVASVGNLIYNNKLIANGGDGISITTPSAANVIINNFIKRSGAEGIQSFSSTDIILGNVLKRSAQNGMSLTGSESIVYNNRVKRSTLDGINIVVGMQNRFISNTIKGSNNSGLALSSANIADQNTIKNNRVGIFTSFGSDNNAIRRNQLRNTTNIVNQGANNVFDENN